VGLGTRCRDGVGMVRIYDVGWPGGVENKFPSPCHSVLHMSTLYVHRLLPRILLLYLQHLLLSFFFVLSKQPACLSPELTQPVFHRMELIPFPPVSKQCQRTETDAELVHVVLLSRIMAVSPVRPSFCPAKQRFSNFFDYGPLFSSGIVSGPPHKVQNS